jgi:hypothetical protein
MYSSGWGIYRKEEMGVFWSFEQIFIYSKNYLEIGLNNKFWDPHLMPTLHFLGLAQQSK